MADEPQLLNPGESEPGSRPATLTWLAWAAVALLLAVVGFFLGSQMASGPRADSAEVGFARDMITHHAQAVDMATLLRDRSDDPELRQIALDMALTQQAQIGQMQGWLSAWGYPAANAGPAMAWMGMPMTGLMPGMAAPEQMNQLRELEGGEADILFLQLMITHHQSGVEMAQAALERAQRPEVRALAQAMVDAQTYEIAVMQGMLEEKGAQPAEAPQGMEEGHH
jgi:uncharacterized protein (DUF305 family)